MAQLKLRSLLMIGFGLLLAMFAIIGGLSMYFANALTSNVEDLVTRRMPNITDLSLLEKEVFTVRTMAISVLAEHTATPGTVGTLNEILDTRMQGWKEIDKAVEDIKSHPVFTQATKELLDKLYAAMAEYERVSTPLDSIHQRLIQAAVSGDENQYRKAHDEYKTAYEKVPGPSKVLREIIAENLQRQTARTIEYGNDSVELGRTFTVLVSTLGLAGIVAGILIGFSILRAVFRQIGGEPAYIQSIMDKVRNADLSVKVDLRPGDTSSALYSIATTTSGLREMMDLISRSANEIAASSEELSVTSEKIAASSESQSQAATTMAAAVEQMTVSINHVSESANDANKMAQQSGEAAREGANTIRSVVADINRVAHDIGDAAKSIEELGEQSREIASVVNIIKEVADQTNLLALNAAIEAARAGEQGRGFAVVADEVRKLAERTSSSTEDIARIVGQISTGTGQAVQTMRQQSESVKTTVDLSERAGTTVGQINDASTSVQNAVSEISLALSEQSTTSSEIAKNVECIATMSEDNTGAVREVAQAIQALSKRAALLQEAVSRFQF